MPTHAKLYGIAASFVQSKLKVIGAVIEVASIISEFIRTYAFAFSGSLRRPTNTSTTEKYWDYYLSEIDDLVCL